MLGLVHNAMKGSFTAKFYTDSWPEFSALVCEQIFPRMSDVRNPLNSVAGYTFFGFL